MTTLSGPPASHVSHPFADTVERAVLAISCRWLLVLIVYGGTVAILPIVAPLLRAAGVSSVAAPIYFAYAFICHQHADRSIHLYGEQMAYCARDMAIFSGAVAVAMIYAIARRLMAIAAIGSWLLVAAVLPIGLDGATQLAGLRDSTSSLRIATGLWFSCGVGWYLLPRLETAFFVLASDIQQRAPTTPVIPPSDTTWMERRPI